MMKFFFVKCMFLVLLGLGSVSGYALEIDEKLTLRIVGTSNSKKTMLINRGSEDALKVNDHAKFFVSTGVVARGVCIKVSPTRSVWSMYRVVSSDFLREEQVMKLKITPAVKITKDESRMLVADDSRLITPKDPRDIGIPLAEGADDLNSNQVAQRIVDLDLPLEERINLLKRNKEIFGMVSYSSYSEKTSPDSTGSDFTNDVTNLHLRFGGEWYFPHENKWYSRISFTGHFALDRTAVMANQGAFVRESSSEFGFGTNIYFSRRPSQIHRLIQYLNYTFSLGSVNTNYKSGEESTTYPDETVDGSTISNAFGYGLKYFTSQGYGARMEFSYVLRGDDFAQGPATKSWLKTKIGPRLLFGISKRF